MATINTDMVLNYIRLEADDLADTYEANYDFDSLLTRLIELSYPESGIKLINFHVLTTENIQNVGNSIDDVEERNEVMDRLKQARYLLENGYNPFDQGTAIHEFYDEYVDSCTSYTDSVINDIHDTDPELYEELKSAVDRIISRSSKTRK